MKKMMNVLEKITVAVAVCTLVVSATTTHMYKSHSSVGSQQLVSCSAFGVSVCAKDEKPSPDERPLGDVDMDYD